MVSLTCRVKHWLSVEGEGDMQDTARWTRNFETKCHLFGFTSPIIFMCSRACLCLLLVRCRGVEKDVVAVSAYWLIVRLEPLRHL